MATQLTLLTRVAYEEHAVASPRLRQLLAALATDLPTGASTMRLVELLWPDTRPEHPTKALQVLVSRARSQLGAGVIVSTPTGYRLGLTADQVDASAALLRVAACERAARDGDQTAVLAHAEAGLALWDAAPLQDLDADDPLACLRSEHTTTYAALLRLRSLALSRLGRHAEALPLLERLALSRPRDEQVLAALLRSEAEVESASAALARYETYRRSLRDDLGADPGSQLQAVQQELLGAGREKIRAGVPFAPNSLVGRDDDLRAVSALIRRSRVTSIVGPGGLGKTRLAHLVSHRADQPRVQFVALAGVSSPDAVLPEVASALGVRDQRLRRNVPLSMPRDVLAGIVEALSPGPSLLVLDNCEHLIEAVADLVRSLIAMSPTLRVLTTSRAPLGVTSESVYLLPELDLDMSVDLFTQRARAARPGVELPDSAVRRLCAHLDGLPLALELAAARARVMSVAQIAERLGDRFALLRGGPRDAPERHRTLQAVIDWSWNLLKPSEQSTLAALSVFPDGFTLDGAEALLRDETGPIDLVDSLDALIEQSLLKVEDRTGGTRYRMLETVREFGAARLQDSGDTATMRAAFQRWATRFATASTEPLFGADPLPVLDLLRDEQDNLVAALRTALAGGSPRSVAATFAALGSLWAIESNHSRTMAYTPDVTYVLSHYRPAADDIEQLRCALVLCATDLMLGRMSGMRALVALRRLPDAVPDTPMRAFALLMPRIGDLLEPDSPAARELRDSPYPQLAGAASLVIGHAWENDGEVRRAVAETRRLIAGPTTMSGMWQQALIRSRLGELYLQAGDLEAGERELRDALATLERFRADADVQSVRWALALSALTRGDIRTAQDELDRAEHISIDHPFGHGIHDDLRVRAELDLARGSIDTGLRRWRRVLDRLRTSAPTMRSDPPGLEPWTLSIESQALIAHARHDRLADVAALAPGIAAKLGQLADRDEGPVSPFSLDLPVYGLGVLALGLTALRRRDGGARDAGATLVALSDRFGYPRYLPSASPTWAHQFACERERSAYQSAVDRYADLPRDERVPQAVQLLDRLHHI